MKRLIFALLILFFVVFSQQIFAKTYGVEEFFQYQDAYIEKLYSQLKDRFDFYNTEGYEEVESISVYINMTLKEISLPIDIHELQNRSSKLMEEYDLKLEALFKCLENRSLHEAEKYVSELAVISEKIYDVGHAVRFMEMQNIHEVPSLNVFEMGVFGE